MALFAIILATAAAYCTTPEVQDGKAPTLLQVGGDGPLHFVGSGPNCPNDGPECRLRSYVVPGDPVLIRGVSGRFACAEVLAGGHDTNGWLATDRLFPPPPAPSPRLSDWAGDWRGLGDDHIRLTPRKSGTLRVDGGAYWPARNPGPDFPGGPNLGQLSGEVVTKGSVADYQEGQEDYSCRAKLQLMGPYLVVQDNNHCGGMNVSFTGVYRRQP